MNDFRGPLPLDDSDFADVRRKVRARIERRSVTPIVFRLALAAAALIALVVILRPRPNHPSVKPLVAVHKEVPVVAPPARPVEVVRVPPPRPSPKPKRKPEQQIASTSGPPPDSDITINIQTADPNVRIIWIAQR